jgi:DNA ligase-1
MKGDAIGDLSKLRFPVYASPKIDGFRCVLGSRPLTSRLSEFPNRHFDRELRGLVDKRMPLDGEVVVGKRRGKGVLGRTSSGLTSEAGEPDFTLWVFDCPLASGGWLDRFNKAREIVGNLDHPQIRILKHRPIYNIEQLEEYLDYCLRKEYEGIITRLWDGPYKEGKSTLREQYMLKIKPFDTAEGRVTGWYEEMENTNEAKRENTGKLKRSSSKAGKKAKGTLGGLILEDILTGVEVRVGGGFTKKQREGLWSIKESLNGKLVRYTKQRMGEKDKPRHSSFVDFVDFRPEWDMSA